MNALIQHSSRREAIQELRFVVILVLLSGIGGFLTGCDNHNAELDQAQDQARKNAVIAMSAQHEKFFWQAIAITAIACVGAAFILGIILGSRAKRHASQSK